MNFAQDETVFDIKLQVTIVADIVGFIQEVGNELLNGFPIFSFNFVTKITKHIWRDGEMFRRHGVVAMEVVKYWGIFEVAFHKIPRVAVGGNAHQVKASNFLLRKEAEISYGQWLAHCPPYKLLQSVYDSQEGGFEGS